LRSLAADCVLEISAQTAVAPPVVELAAVVLLLELPPPPQPTRSDAIEAAVAIGTANVWRTASSFQDWVSRTGAAVPPSPLREPRSLLAEGALLSPGTHDRTQLKREPLG